MTNEAIVREGLKDTDALAILEATMRELRRPAAQAALWATLRKYGPGGMMERTTDWEDVGEGFLAATGVDPMRVPHYALIDGCIRKAREKRLARLVTQADPWDAAKARLAAEDARRTTK